MLESLTEGKVYACEVIGAVYGKKNVPLYKVRLADGRSERVYLTKQLRFYAGETAPDKVYCRVVTQEDGTRELVQDEFTALSMLYAPDKVYAFKVLSQLSNSQTGKRRYLVSAINGYLHIFTSHQDEELAVGDTINRMVAVKRFDDGTAGLYYRDSNETVKQLSAFNLFDQCGHSDDYVKFYLTLIERKEELRTKGYLIDDMLAKLKSFDRLWVLDYLSVLYYWVFQKEDQPVEVIKRGSMLLEDIDTWLLEDHKLLLAFGPEKREKTRYRAERTIWQARFLGEACDIVLAGEQDGFLEKMLTKLRKTGYIFEKDRAVKLVLHFMRLDSEYVQRNIEGLSELLIYLPQLQAEDEVRKLLVRRLVQLMNGERKALSNALLFDYTTSPEQGKLKRLALLMGSVIFYIDSQKGMDEQDLSISIRLLFADLCRCLSMLTTPEKGVQLIDKALAYLIVGSTEPLLRIGDLNTLTTDPEPLVDGILSLSLGKEMHPLMTATSMVLMRYQEETLTMARMPKGTLSPTVGRQAKTVFHIPGTKLKIASLVDGEPWQNGASLLYYRDKWRVIHTTDRIYSSLSTKESGVLIRTKALNQAYKGLIFCRSADSSFYEDGAIGFHGYAKHFRITDLTECFSEGLLLVADVERLSNGRIELDINRNLMEYSNAHTTIGKQCLAHCLGYSKETAQAFFITQEGVMCKSEPNPTYRYEISGGYEVVLTELQEGEFPLCRVNGTATVLTEAKTLLRDQLSAISRFNEERHRHTEEYHEAAQYDFPYIHLYTHQYLHLIQEPVAVYNLLHFLRLLTIKERSTLSYYYSALIQQMELRACRQAGLPFESSLPEFVLSDSLVEQFPTLKGFADELRRVNQIAQTTDMETLFDLCKNGQQDAYSQRLARIALAKQLLNGLGADSVPLFDQGEPTCGYDSTPAVVEERQQQMLRLFPDSSYQLGEGTMPGLPVAQVLLSNSGFVVQVFDNGTLSRVPVEGLWQQRQGIARTNGARLTRLLWLSEGDAVVTRLVRNQRGFVKVVPLDQIDVVEHIGGAGSWVVAQQPGDRIEVYPLRGDSKSVNRFVFKNPECLGLQESFTQNEEQLSGLWCRIAEQEPKHLVSDQTLQSWLQQGAFDRIAYYLDSVRLSDEMVSKQTTQMEKLLECCADGECFWKLVEVLLRRDVNLYGDKIELYVQQRELASLRPTSDVLDRIAEYLIGVACRLALAMRLFYPVRSIVSDPCKAIIREAKKEFKVPVLYLQLIELAGLSIPELKVVLLQEDTPPARYALFEVMRRQHELGEVGYQEVLQLFEHWGTNSVMDQITQDLFRMGILQMAPRWIPEDGVRRVLDGGYQVYNSACQLTPTELNSFCNGNMQAYVGRQYRLRIEQSFAYHYLAHVGKTPVLIPRKWCVTPHTVGQQIEVRIAQGLNRQRTLFGAEQGMPDPLPEAEPLLKEGDTVTLTFEPCRNGMRPVIRKQFNRIRVLVRQYPDVIEPGRVYRAIVGPQKEELVYVVKVV